MATQNQAWVLPNIVGRTGFDALKIVESPVPKPSKGEVLVAVKAVSLNYRDLIITKNRYPGLPDKEIVVASDGAGQIVEVGEGVEGWKKDDRVMSIFNRDHQKSATATKEEYASGLGGFIDGMLIKYKVLPATSLVRIPSHLSYEEASTLPCAAVTSWNSLYGLPGSGPKPGETVVAEGTGGVSVFTAQFGVAAGCRTVITSSSDEKLEKVRASIPKDKQHLLHTFNYSKDPNWDEEVLRVSEGVGATSIVEVGGAGTIERALKCIKRGGVVGAVGFVAKGTVPNIPQLLIFSSAVFRGIFVGSKELFEDMNAAIEAHQIRPLVDKVFNFKDAAEAYQYQWDQKHVGKVVIRVDA